MVDRDKLYDPLEHKYSPDYQESPENCRICGKTQEAHQVHEPEPRAQCSNCHHFHPDADDTKYLYGSGLCHRKTEYHKHTKRESSTNWCSAHKPKGE